MLVGSTQEGIGIMDVKAYLRNVRKLSLEIKSKRRQRESLYYLCTGSAIRYDIPKVQTSADNRLEKILADVAELDKSIAASLRRLAQKQLTAIEMINSTTKPEYIAILTDYYMNAYTWEKVADLNGYSVQHTKRMHGYALNELKEKYETK